MALEKIMKTKDAAKSCLLCTKSFIEKARELKIQPFSIKKVGGAIHYAWRISDVERIQNLGILN